MKIVEFWRSGSYGERKAALIVGAVLLGIGLLVATAYSTSLTGEQVANGLIWVMLAVAVGFAAFVVTYMVWSMLADFLDGRHQESNHD